MRSHFFGFFKYWQWGWGWGWGGVGVYFIECSLDLISAIKRCPILPLWDILSKVLLSSVRLGRCSCFFIQPYGRALVIACLYWLFSSILSILVDILFVCFFPSMYKYNMTFSFLLLLSNISVSKASLVFTQLKPPISVFSNTLTCSWLVGRAMQHLLLSLWTQPLKELAELIFLGLNLKRSCR